MVLARSLPYSWKVCCWTVVEIIKLKSSYDMCSYGMESKLALGGSIVNRYMKHCLVTGVVYYHHLLYFDMYVEVVEIYTAHVIRVDTINNKQA